MSEKQSFDDIIARGVEAIESGKLEEALKIALEAQEKDDTSADGYHLEAIAYQHQYKWDESLNCLHKAIEHAPYDASLYSLRGFAYMSLEQMDKAQADFDEAISLEDFEAAHRNLVLLKISQGKTQEAVDYLIGRIQTKPEDSDNLTLMGNLLKIVGEEEKAQTYFDEAEKLNQQQK